MVNSRWAALRTWLWPGHCLLCRARTRAGHGLCDPCRAQLPWLRAACPVCAVPLAGEPSAVACGACQKKPPPFDHTRAALNYAAPVDRLILPLKYHRRLDLARTLGHLLADALGDLPARPDLLIPMPLHASRRRGRGYNQWLERGQGLGRRFDLRVEANLARRVRATAAQANLSRADRARNVRNAFAATEKLSGLNIAIVDDVMTS